MTRGPHAEACAQEKRKRRTQRTTSTFTDASLKRAKRCKQQLSAADEQMTEWHVNRTRGARTLAAADATGETRQRLNGWKGTPWGRRVPGTRDGTGGP